MKSAKNSNSKSLACFKRKTTFKEHTSLSNNISGRSCRVSSENTSNRICNALSFNVKVGLSQVSRSLINLILIILIVCQLLNQSLICLN